MALSVREQRLLDEISERIAADDPVYHRRMSDFGGHDVAELGLPGRWAALLVALLGIALVAMTALFFAVSSQAPASDGARVQHSLHH